MNKTFSLYFYFILIVLQVKICNYEINTVLLSIFIHIHMFMISSFFDLIFIFYQTDKDYIIINVLCKK